MKIKHEQDGWKIVADEGILSAIHEATGQTYGLEILCGEVWCAEDSEDWMDAEVEESTYADLIAAGRLRVRGVIHGLESSSPLGAVLC